MRVVVTGGSGLLGRAVCQRLKEEKHEVIGTAFSRASEGSNLRKVDLTDSTALTTFLQESNCDAIIHTAAERRPDVVEKSPEASYKLNVEVPSRIAEWCKGQSQKAPLLVNISTDYVFDGTSPPYKIDDAPNPLNAYGKSKWDGEKGVIEHGKSGRITNLRVPVLYGRTESNDESAVNILLDAISKPASGSKKMDANAVRYPTNVDDVAKALSQILQKGAEGREIPPTLHFSAMEAMTKYDMCLVMARCLRSTGEEVETEHLVPEYEIDPNAATSRPRHCKLDLSVTKDLGIDTTCIEFESWWREFLKEYAKAMQIKREQEERERRVKEAEQRRIEEEERQKREEQERKRQEEQRQEEQRQEKQRQEEQRQEAERRKIQEEEEQKRKLEDEAKTRLDAAAAAAAETTTTTPTQANPSIEQQETAATSNDAMPSSSSAGQTSSLRSPESSNSPNPSFSSLQARPTPPATSGRASPTHSDTSERHRGVVPTSASTSLTEIDEQRQNNERELESAVNPLEISRATPVGSQSIVVQSDTARETSSDDYGPPSPRNEKQSTGIQQAFAAGYGEVPFGLENITTASMSVGRSTAGAVAQSSTGPVRALFQIRVGDPQKVGDPVTAHIVYTVRIKTEALNFKAKQFSVLRRYSDFRWLHAALVHNNPGIFVPPVPEKVKIGRFAPDLVEARRHGLESCINKIANNPVLQHDEDFKLFIESENFHADVRARDQVKGPVPTPEQKTYFGWSTSFTGSSYKYHENDEWFDEQNVFLDHLEMQLKTLVRIVSSLAQQRKDVAAATSEMSHAMMMLSGSSLSRSLSTCFAGLGEVERRTFELLDVQADCDIREFGSMLYEFERMVGSARKAFSTRIDAWQTWQRMEDDAKKVRIRHEKVKKDMQPGSIRAHDGGRLQAALDELANAESKCLNAKREFDIIGRRCKEEMDRFEWDRIASLHEACENWLQGMIEKDQEIAAEWEQYAALLHRQTGQSIAAKD